MRTSLFRFLLAVLVVSAASGCSDDNGTGPSNEGGVITTSGTFMDVDDQNEFQARLQITFESIEKFVEMLSGDEIMREVTTGPTKIYLRGHNEFLIAAAAALETNPIRVRYWKRSDGICSVTAAMNAQPETGDRFALNFIARYEQSEWLGKPGTLDDIHAASGTLQVTGIQDTIRSAVFCRDLFVSIQGMRSLIEEFEGRPVDAQMKPTPRGGAGNAR